MTKSRDQGVGAMPAEKCTPGEAKRVAVAGTPFEIRPLLPTSREGWPQLAMGEWQLDHAGFGDRHPYDEVNYVLEGELEVECDGVVLRAGPGEVIRVPASTPAFYRAHDRARMLYIYGPNPEGLPSDGFPDPNAPHA